MGIEFHDIICRIEKKFDIKIEHIDLDPMTEHRTNSDMTASDLHFLAGVNIRESGRHVPENLWHELQEILKEALGVDREEIKPDAWLIKDLGMT